MKERNVVLQGMEQGEPTMDFPITRLGNIEGSADVKQAPAEGDYIPVLDGGDGGQMKKMPFSAVAKLVEEAISAAITGAIKEAY